MPQSTVIGRLFKQRKAARRYIEWNKLRNFEVIKVADGYMALKLSNSSNRLST